MVPKDGGGGGGFFFWKVEGVREATEPVESDEADLPSDAPPPPGDKPRFWATSFAEVAMSHGLIWQRQNLTCRYELLRDGEAFDLLG